ncbi:MAG: hypothetical protein HY787_14350 [Deltaproteobacteria bacterium]|nr:hypothetical protein [Deltaproteobacteria bacterium]
MGIRTIRMDDDTERLLSRIIQTTGLSITAAFKEGLKVFQNELIKTKRGSPYDLYKEMNLGPGGYAKTPSTEVKNSVKEAIKRKLKR